MRRRPADLSLVVLILAGACGGGAAEEVTSTTTSTTEPATATSTAVSGPAPTPAGWVAVDVEDWHIALPRHPKREPVPLEHDPERPYDAMTVYGVEGFGALVVLDFDSTPSADLAETALSAVVATVLPKATVGAVSDTDVQGRAGATAGVTGAPCPTTATAFAAARHLFVLVACSADHPTALATFSTS